MQTFVSRFASVLLALASAATLAPSAHAQTGTPQSPYVITAAPYTITKPGYYVLGNNLSYAGTSGNILTVDANNVTLDFNGFYIAGPAGNTSQMTYGVRATERSNVTVKNGTVAYCYVGIYLNGNESANTNAVGEAVDNMRVTYCYYIGIAVISCPGSTITSCKVTQTGYSGATDAYAIYSVGSGEAVQNSTVIHGPRLPARPVGGNARSPMSSPTLAAPLPTPAPTADPERAADEVVLSVHGVSKHYKLWSSPSERLRYSALSQAHRTLRALLPEGSAALRGVRRRRDALHRDFTALHELSFEVSRGESLGIIGRNGSGKSTLLQIVAGTLRPSTGHVEVAGRVVALLELGSGFNMEYTGRENVYLNAAVLGLTRAEVEAKFDAIVAFADIGQFLDQPVKTYSSGMVLRLAFAVSIHVDPDILIVDEALAVGDVFFTQKCFQRLREIIDAGTTFLFVSHSMAAVQNPCSRALLLKEGKVLFEGPPEEAASRYYAVCAGGTREEAAVAGSQGVLTVNPLDDAPEAARLRQEVLAHDILPSARSRHGTTGDRDLEIAAAAFVNPLGEHLMSLNMLDTCQIHLLLRARRPVAAPMAGIHVYDRMNNLVFAAGTRQLDVPLSSLAAGEERLLTFRIGWTVQPGEYTFSLGCSEPAREGPNQGFIHDRHEGLGPVSVHYDSEKVMPFYGVARLPMEVEQWR